MFHGDNERVDVESLGLSTELWDVVAHDLLDLTATRSRVPRLAVDAVVRA